MQTIGLNSGARMPALALGTWRLTGDSCEQAVRWALDAGYRHVDTAAMYGNEEAVGAGIRSSGVPREEVFVTTKLRDHGSPVQAATASLERLGLDYVDCYLIHWPAGRGADVDVWPALEGLQRDGTVRTIGVSNYSAAQMQEMLEAADVPPAVNQIELNPFVRQRDVEQLCHDRGVVVQAYQPLGRASRFDDPRIAALAERYGRTAAQIMLRWGLQQGTAVVPKSGNHERISSNADIFDFELAADDMAALDALG